MLPSVLQLQCLPKLPEMADGVIPQRLQLLTPSRTFQLTQTLQHLEDPPGDYSVCTVYVSL